MERSPKLSRALWTICAADLLVTLDGTVVTVALPSIQRDLGIAVANLQWVVTASTHLGGALVLTVLATAAAFRSSAAVHNGVPNASALTSGFSLAFLIGAAFGAVTALRTLRDPSSSARRSR